MRSFVTLVFLFAAAEAQTQTAMVVQPAGQCGQPAAQCGAPPTCGQAPCNRPPLPPLEDPKVRVSKGNTYTIKKISKKKMPVEEAIQKKVVDPEFMEVDCVHEYEAYRHNHHDCPACPDAKSAQETVNKVEWDVYLMREKLSVYIPVPAKKRLVHENERPRISGEILLVHKPTIKTSDVRVKKCSHVHPNEIEDRGDCDFRPAQPAPPPPTCATATCAGPTCNTCR